MTLGRTAIALVFSAIAAAPALARPPAASPDGGAAVLDIPYVPQSEALCGGAAAAMVLRFWGATKVVAEDFSPLLERDGSGIRVDRLAAGIRARGWSAVALTGTDALAQDQLDRGRPVIALVSAGRGRFHYVVIASWSERRVIVHDPARAPRRVYAPAAFEAAWAKARHWMLVVTPAAGSPLTPADPSVGPTRAAGPTVSATGPAMAPGRSPTAAAASNDSSRPGSCEQLVGDAVDGADRGDDAVRLRMLLRAIEECPASSAAHRELAGYRLIHGAPADAATLAAEAVRLDPADAHAWYLLGAARYLSHDVAGALDAWNHIGEPRLDLVDVEGLTRSTYESVAGSVGLNHGDTVNAEELAMARRRVTDLPAVSASHVDLEPRGGGLAQIDVGVVERSTVPMSRAEFAIAGARAAIDREVSETFNNVIGTGDAWTADWRWWTNRPRVGLALAAPGLLGTHAVWQLDASWEAQSYSTPGTIVRNERTHGGLSASDWMTSRWKWRAASGLERWSDRGAFWFGGGGLDFRSQDDRLESTVDATVWVGSTAFGQTTATASWTSRPAPRGWRFLTSAEGSFATADAPLDIWNGAGAGHARAPLLRAHPLLDDGVVAGPAFGRVLENATVAAERWPSAIRLWSIGVAAFVDAAAVQNRLAGGNAWFADAGAGVRLRAAWLPGIVRVDYAHGLRDGANAVSVGWAPGAGR